MTTASYSSYKERQRIRAAEQSASGRDIGRIPPVRDPRRRAACNRNFKEFCETYFSEVFNLTWSDDHIKVINKIETSVLTGGLFAHAMPRGSGKTTLTRISCIWALLSGARRYVSLIGATADRGDALLEQIKTSLETNELLLADYPEVLFPIRSLERIVNRVHGQTHNGEATRITWTLDKVVLPTVRNSPASGSVITSAGLEGGQIRGQIHQLPSGETIRPDLCVIDDPQTTESAYSEPQSRRREAILAGDVLGMAGPGKKISGILCCTVIRPGDMADSILDRRKHPWWHGERTKMIYTFPANETLWGTYREILEQSLQADGSLEPATNFYRDNREAMDAGAVIAWPERHNTDELSAIQHAMNLRFRNEAAFFSEYQNEPLVENLSDLQDLTTEQVMERINQRPRREIPREATELTAFVDVQQKLLYYLVIAWEKNFTGYVIDYGTYPEQRRHVFNLTDVRTTLQTAAPNAGLEGSIYAGLDNLWANVLGQEWQREDGAAMRISRGMIDANWGLSTDVVYKFCKQSKFSAQAMPSHGRYVGASSLPFSEYKRQAGDQVGLNWRIPTNKKKRTIRYCVYDTNFWKSFIYTRLSTPLGQAGNLTIWGTNPEVHRLLATHATAEFRVRTEGRGRTVDEWKLKPFRPDNHFFDALVGNAVIASILGCRLDAHDTDARQRRSGSRMKLSELQAGGRGR